MDSDSLNEVSNESLNDDFNPLFLKLDCKIYSESKIGRCSVHVIPTCICKFIFKIFTNVLRKNLWCRQVLETTNRSLSFCVPNLTIFILKTYLYASRLKNKSYKSEF